MEESRGERVVQSVNEERVTNDDSTSSPSDSSSTASQDYHPRGYDDCETKRRKIWNLAEVPPIARDDFQFIGRSKNNRNVGGVGVVENLSRRNEPSNMNQLREFQEFHEFHEFHGRETSQLTIGKSREYDFASVRRIDDDPLNGRATCDGEVTCDGESSKLICRTRETTTAMSEPGFFNLVATRKYLSGNFERCPKELNYLVERETKDYGITKGYGLSLDRTKEYGVSERQIRDDPTILPCRKRPYGAIGINDDGHHEANYDQRDDIDGNLRIHRQRESIVYERIKRRNPHEREFLGHGLIQQNLGQTCATQIQPQLQEQEQQQQKQIKSFTIDAILAHRNQRERHQKNQQAQQKKSAKRTRHHHECEEITVKVTGTSVNEATIGNAVSGKAKRVRTIFTVEQLERLESEFARQQYMVGPERLYLAHALRLTEAQVKVWFQNRRIKWRKVNQEQHRQAVSEHRQRQRCSLPSGDLDVNDEDESNETINWCVNNSITGASSIDDHVPLMIVRQILMSEKFRRRRTKTTRHPYQKLAKIRPNRYRYQKKASDFRSDYQRACAPISKSESEENGRNGEKSRFFINLLMIGDEIGSNYDEPSSEEAKKMEKKWMEKSRTIFHSSQISALGQINLDII